MRSRVLPLHDPLVIHSPANTYLLSIIGSDKIEYAWIMNNFINLRINPYTKYDDFYRIDMWYNCPFIANNIMSRDLIRGFTPTNIIDIFIDSLNQGYYIYAPLMAREKISAYNTTKVNDTHNILIYGYDYEDKLIYIADFYKSKFTFLTAEFQDVKNAYYAYEDREEKIKDWISYYGFYFFKKHKLLSHDFLNREKMLQQIKDYILSTDKHKDCYYPFLTNDLEYAFMEDIPNAFDFKFGLSFYDVLVDLMMEENFLIRPFHLLHQQKKLMNKRLDYLEATINSQYKEQLNNECQVLERLSMLTRNLYFKFLLKNQGEVNCQIKIKLIENLKQIQEKDFCFMNNLYKALS